MSKKETKYETSKIALQNAPVVNFLYHTKLGRILLKILTKIFVSRFIGLFLNSRFSQIFINSFIKRNKIDMDEYKKTKYLSFNDFFIREINPKYRPISNNNQELVSPCDGKVTAYEISDNNCFIIKQQRYSVQDLIQDTELANDFIGGTALIFRLEPTDYHRYCYISDGRILEYKKIDGVLHTVQPIAHKYYNVYGGNSREYAILSTIDGHKYIQMEVGALLVGKILNHKQSGEFKRGEEKGLFEFGGSTIVMLFQKDAIELDKEFYLNTEQDMETIVKLGETIGLWNDKL